VAKRRSLLKCYAAFTVVALGIAVICFFGVVLKEDLVGRVIFWAMWSLVAFYWLGRYLHARMAGRSSRD
jgi:cation transport ATPase